MAELEEDVLKRIERQRALKPRFRDPHITMSHGAGGKATHTLVAGLIAEVFDNPILAELDDAATLDAAGTQIGVTTDAFVVKPLVFPGGSIGELAINGTLNDLAVAGVKPIAITVALVIEEGLPAEVLRRELDAMATAARAAGVPVVAGDTKVVERGKADGLYIVTTGVGTLVPGLQLSSRSLRPGDRVLCSGAVGDHGVAIMLARGELELDADIASDTAPVSDIATILAEVAGPGLRMMRDPTRGGLATVLNELAMDSDLGIVVEEEAVVVHPPVKGACEILGIDPMYVANEGKLVAVLAPDVADQALEAVRRLPSGSEAALVGEVAQEPRGMVLIRTGFGGTRIMDMLIGDPLPRIC